MIAKVVVDISNSEVDRIFEYSIPEDLEISAGDRVAVAFGKQGTIEGFVVGLSEKQEYKGELKPVIKKLDGFSAISQEMLSLMSFMQATYNLRMVDVLRLFIPAKLRGGIAKELIKSYAMLNDNFKVEEILSSLRSTAVAQRAVVAKLASCEGEWVSALNEEFGAQAVKALVEKGFVQTYEKKVNRQPYKNVGSIDEKHNLTAEQQSAFNKIFEKEEGTYLLHGVTGSGKTEVYIRCIDQVISSGKNAVMLVPEISLTPQMMSRFRGRFGDKVALLHSGLSTGERFDEWLRLLRGEAKIAVGARSAIFAPLQNVGIIIIDEEHDTSYVSESTPRYFTAEVAEFRRRYNKGKLILGSATPDLDTYKMAMDGEIELITLKNRVTGREMPEIAIVDMCQELRAGNRTMFSKQLIQGLEDTLSRGEQAMVFLNRRGYSAFMMCKKCGHVIKCSDCDVSLTWHREESRLKCHYCGKQFTVPSSCPICGSESIRYGRDGTEKIVSDLQKKFPKARFLRMDNDTTRRKNGYVDILTSFANKEADILVGTQMIAKGHDFPNVTFVGIIDADMSLYYEDFHSAEKTFQLVTQVAGRAGRASLKGQVVLQTYSPKHFVFYFATRYDYEGFYKKEINIREVSAFPPFTTIVRVLISGVDEAKVAHVTRNLLYGIREVQKAYQGEFVYLQAMRSPKTRLEGKFRYQVLMRLKRNKDKEIISRVYKCVDENRIADVLVITELNPQNLM